MSEVIERPAISNPMLEKPYTGRAYDWTILDELFPGTATGSGDDDGNNVPLLAPWKPKLIGLTGRARSGKNTAADLLTKAFGVKQVAFATPIKESLRTMMGLDDRHLHGDLKETTLDWLGKSPRQLMQTLGTEWGRGYVNDSIWLILAEREIERLMEDEMVHVAVTDVRFENEARQIRDMGGTIWHIRRDGVQQVNSHASESGIMVRTDKGDIVIDNNGTLDDLLDAVIDAF